MYDALGMRFTLGCADSDLRTHLVDVLSGLEVAHGSSAHAVPPVALDVPPLERPSPEAATLFMGMVSIRAVRAAEGFLLLHAGAVSRPDGGSMLLCGPSGSGKSTLTAVLSSRYAYLTDEAVCMEPSNLRITPFRKPLALKPGALRVLPHLRPKGAVAQRYSRERCLIPPSSLGSPPPPPQPVLPELVVFPTWSPCDDLDAEEMSTSECAYLLGTNASSLESVRGGPLSALARLSRRTRAYRVRFTDPWQAASALDELWEQAS